MDSVYFWRRNFFHWQLSVDGRQGEKKIWMLLVNQSKFEYSEVVILKYQDIQFEFCTGLSDIGIYICTNNNGEEEICCHAQ